MPGLQGAGPMQMGHVAASLAYCNGGVKNHNDRLDNPRMRVQNLATLPAQVGTCHGNSRGLAGQGGAYARCSFEPRILTASPQPPPVPERRRCPRCSAGCLGGRPIAGQAQPVPDDPSKVLGGPLRPYGERSRFEQTVREKSPGRRRTRSAAPHAPGRNAGDHHAVGAPLRGPPQWCSRHRPAQAPSPDPRHGRSSGDPDHGGDQAPALDVAHPLPRVRGQHCRSGVRPRRRASGHTRRHELQRVDRRAAVAPAARGRRPAGRCLDRRRGRRQQRQRAQHPDGEGDGRRPGRLRPERRGGAPGERLSAAAHCSWLDGQHQRQVAAPHQGGGPALSDPDGRRGATHPHAGRQGPTAQVRHGGEVGDHLPSGGQRLPGPGFYEIRGLAWSGRGLVRRVEVSTDGGKTWRDARLQEPVLRFAHTRFRLDWRWDGREAILQSRCTDETGYVQPTLAELVGSAA